MKTISGIKDKFADFFMEKIQLRIKGKSDREAEEIITEESKSIPADFLSPVWRIRGGKQPYLAIALIMELTQNCTVAVFASAAVSLVILDGGGSCEKNLSSREWSESVGLIFQN